jgi:hypothetical protein
VTAVFLTATATARAQSDEIGQPPPPPPPAECGTASVITKGTSSVSIAEVLRADKIGCKGARRIVRRCVSGNRVKGWKAGEFDFATTLRNDDQRVTFHMVTGPPARCARLLKTARQPGLFGPFQEPNQYPDKWPAPFKMITEWQSPVMTYAAYLRPYAVSTVDIQGVVRTGPTVRSVWFEYGLTRDLGTSTERQAPPTSVAGNDRGNFQAHLAHLRAKTRYFWQAVASVDDGAGGVATVRGAMGSFVTKPYPTIKDANDPCGSRPDGPGKDMFELTESLAIACDPWGALPYHITKGACFPACTDYYHGTISCSKDFPRNLNAGNWSFNIPKIGYPVYVNELVSYWRSNDSNRFLTYLPGKNKNSSGGEVGPVPGWHDWDVGQWAYPFTPTETDVRFWINCTEQWGTVINGDALAQGEGNDRPSNEAPGVPGEIKVTKAGDGGVDVSWKAPNATSPSGISGYYVSYQGWKRNDPKTFVANQITPVSSTGTTGHISKGLIDVVRKATPGDWEFRVVVAAISREGTVGEPGLAELP